MNDDALKSASQEEKKNFEVFFHWLQGSMPPLFFKEVSEEWIKLIVHGLMSFKVQDYFVEIHLREGAITLCFDTPAADMNILKSYPMYGIKSYTTYVSKEALPFPDNPGLLRVGIIQFTDAKNLNSGEIIEETFLRKLSDVAREEIGKLFERAKINDSCQYHVLRKIEDDKSVQILLAWKNVPKHNFLYRLAKVIYHHGLRMQKVGATYIHPNTTHSILLLSFHLEGSKGESPSQATDFSDFLAELSLLKYFGSLDVIDETFVNPGLLRGNMGNLLRAMIHFIHQTLLHIDPNLYSVENIEEGLVRLPELTIKLCSAFEFKFNPKMHDNGLYNLAKDEFLNSVRQLDTGYESLDSRRKNVLLQGMNFVEHTLKTNFYCAEKTSLAFRLDPHYLEHVPFERKKLFPELPFAIFFFKGMHYQGFHIRFRDLARGGLRTIYPERKERVIAERNSVFLECYHLAYTQHKKNKDIPEGGAKGVIFLKPNERLEEESQIYAHEMHEAEIAQEEIDQRIVLFKTEQKIEYLHQTQRSYVETLLTLINYDRSGSLREKAIIDYWGKRENIFLGPDENMHTEIIDWIAEESKRVGYLPGSAFISGKTGSGLHHKEYGVTSLGVNVFMHELLNYLEIDPLTQPFTVKMTGGPDGDVAGNQILNLYRYYSKTAKLIALTDVSGTIYDPKGLDLAICAHLFQHEKPIRDYPPYALSPGGFMLDKMRRREVSSYVFQTLCYKKTEDRVVEEWLQGNEMNALYRLNVHQTKADLFLPCGGRPRALREENLDEFLDESGSPTAKGIVEGANLYFSSWAREKLEEKGTLIIKDSSANKCGVISSSLEILAGLLLSDEEFMKHRSEIIPEILERLREVAYAEARLLLLTHEMTKEPLGTISDRISEQILHFTDEILAHLESRELVEDEKDPLNLCLIDYCLPFLRKNYKDRILRKLPVSHKKGIIASHIASKLVYKKGVSWMPSISHSLPLLIEELFPT